MLSFNPSLTIPFHLNSTFPYISTHSLTFQKPLSSNVAHRPKQRRKRGTLARVGREQWGDHRGARVASYSVRFSFLVSGPRKSAKVPW